jgi:hypothetical protein
VALIFDVSFNEGRLKGKIRGINVPGEILNKEDKERN